MKGVLILRTEIKGSDVAVEIMYIAKTAFKNLLTL